MSEKNFKKKPNGTVRAVIHTTRSSWVPVNNPASNIKGFRKVLVDLSVMYWWQPTKTILIDRFTMHKHKQEFRFASESFGRHNPNSSLTEKDFEAEITRRFRVHGWRIVREKLESLKLRYFTKKVKDGVHAVEATKPGAGVRRPVETPDPVRRAKKNRKTAKTVPAVANTKGGKGKRKRKGGRDGAVPASRGSAKLPAGKAVQGRVGRRKGRGK